jgi:hypothetical protein
MADSSAETPAVHYGNLAVNKTDITRWCGLLVLGCNVTNMVGSQKSSLSVWGGNRLPNTCVHYFTMHGLSLLSYEVWGENERCGIKG